MEGGAVTYTTKELIEQLTRAITTGLEQLGSRLDAIDSKLDNKADRFRVHEISNSLASLDKRFSLLETVAVRREGPIISKIDAMQTALTLLEAALPIAGTSEERAREVAREELEPLRAHVEALVMWRNRTIGAVVLVTFVMPILATLSWHLWG